MGDIYPCLYIAFSILGIGAGLQKTARNGDNYSKCNGSVGAGDAANEQVSSILLSQRKADVLECYMASV